MLKPGQSLDVRENTLFRYTPGVGVVWDSEPSMGLALLPTKTSLYRISCKFLQDDIHQEALGVWGCWLTQLWGLG
jgi:hypothetical protein